MIKAIAKSWVSHLATCLAIMSPFSAPNVHATQSENAARIARVNRLSWGVSAADQRAVWPPSSPEKHELPAKAEAQIAAMRISRDSVEKIVTEQNTRRLALRSIIDIAEKKKARRAYLVSMNALADEARARFILRSLYSPDQMREQMTWFWCNHFSVHARKSDIMAMVGDYENTIRNRSLGRYRDLLEATLRHPAMLRYLDNNSNATGKINENYAREILELHSMGVGSGYSQQDVQELARILTGVGVSTKAGVPRLKSTLQPLYLREGLFEFNPARHDFGDKHFLGHTINGEGFGEVEKALDLIASSPATAHHVSQRIAIYFTGDVPSPEMVARMARVFIKTDGDIEKVVDSMLRSTEFRKSLGHSFKDPVHYTLSAVRIMYGEQVITNTRPIIDWIKEMGEGLYNRPTPDGYDLGADAWRGPGQMASRFDFAQQIGSTSARLFQANDLPAHVPKVPRLQDAPHVQAMIMTLGKPTRDALAQAKSQEEWNTLFLSSPEFMQR